MCYMLGVKQRLDRWQCPHTGPSLNNDSVKKVRQVCFTINQKMSFVLKAVWNKSLALDLYTYVMVYTQLNYRYLDG